MEKVTDEDLINLVSHGIAQSNGDWLNSSDLTNERLKSTYEYAGLAKGHLAPQGVSSIVDTSTTEVIEAYTAVLCDLFLNNQKLAKFVPLDNEPNSFQRAKEASLITNHAIFKQNKGWEILSSWIKAALLWKNSVIRWDYVEDYEYEIEEYDRIDSLKLDELLSDENVEIIGELTYENEFPEVSVTDTTIGTGEANLVYIDVRLRRKTDKSRVKIENIPPENFRIARDARSIDEASFVGIQTELSRSDIRKMYPDIAEQLTADDMWDRLEEASFRYTEDIAARKMVTGQNYLSDSSSAADFLEANKEVLVTECWVSVDRDGDGIAELKHLIVAGDYILYEEDVDSIPLAHLAPIDIPFEFYGMSMSDFARSSTLASTAILRGFVENTYLTNYSPKLADPNVVDFSALQNMRPKQIIPTNGSPVGAVQALQPETISTGTVPLLEYLQVIKEQATGMSKAAQGLNDTLYVSGNSEAKLQAVQSASQKRIQHIARRFAETGLKALSEGVYRTMRKNLNKNISMVAGSQYLSINPKDLPRKMECEVILDIGENSNMNLIQKLQRVGQEVLPALIQGGQQMVIKPDAGAVIATKMIEAVGLDSNDYLMDYTTPEFQQQAQEAMGAQQQAQEAEQQAAQANAQAQLQLAQANVTYTEAQAKNTSEDNSRQMAIAIDKHFQEWADLSIKAAKEGVQPPPKPSFEEIIGMAQQVMGAQAQQPQGAEDELSQLANQLGL
jgi:hypothetical protein